MVDYTHNPTLLFAGSNDPCFSLRIVRSLYSIPSLPFIFAHFVCHLPFRLLTCHGSMQVSLGNLSPELNEGYSKTFFSYLNEQLGVKDDRGYMCVSLVVGSPSSLKILGACLSLQRVRGPRKCLHRVSVVFVRSCYGADNWPVGSFKSTTFETILSKWSCLAFFFHLVVSMYNIAHKSKRKSRSQNIQEFTCISPRIIT
jgi:hypothetical protein